MKEEKRELRKKLKEQVASLSTDYMRNADALITENILSWEHYKSAQTIFLYITMANEIDTINFIAQASNDGKRICAPKCYKDGTMEARKISGLNDLALGYVGISEPKDHCPVIPKDELDLILVPCLTVDQNGYRLGYGGGFYDRYLKDYKGISVALCRDKQIIKKIPTEGFDIPVGYYVTENGLFKSY